MIIVSCFSVRTFSSNPWHRKQIKAAVREVIHHIPVPSLPTKPHYQLGFLEYGLKIVLLNDLRAKGEVIIILVSREGIEYNIFILV